MRTLHLFEQSRCAFRSARLCRPPCCCHMSAGQRFCDMKSFRTNDKISISYRQEGTRGPVVVLLHGWSGSHRSYDLNIEEIGKHCQVYAPDLRFHGGSDKPQWGYHVHRLAADLRDMLLALELQAVTVIGSSMGAAIIWAYIELYRHDRLTQAVFVDQVPLQNNAGDWKLGSLSCYDAACVARLQTQLKLDFRGVAEGIPRACLAGRLPDGFEAMLVAETLKADPNALGRLMADHTQIDWRPLLPQIGIRCLNVIGCKTGVFPPDGTRVVSQLVPNCAKVEFEECNHFLYMEDPKRFNKLVVDFAHGIHRETTGSIK